MCSFHFFLIFPHFSTANSDCVATLAISRKWHRQRPETRFEHGLANMFGDLNPNFFFFWCTKSCARSWSGTKNCYEYWHFWGSVCHLICCFPSSGIISQNVWLLRTLFPSGFSKPGKHWLQSTWNSWVWSQNLHDAVGAIFQNHDGKFEFAQCMFKHACCVYVCLCKSIGAHQLAHTRHQDVFDVVRAMWNMDVKDATIKWYCCIQLWKVG